MPKLLRDPRVSIVIPLQRDEQLFEATLLSVLENQPADCQIVAAHNGTYSDPFELADEVTFVTARSSNLVDLIRDAFDATTAPIVHVIGTGVKAGRDWMDEALACFDESDVAAVAPTLVDEETNQVGCAGWSDTAGRLCQPQRSATRHGSVNAPNGFYLNTCLIRRRLLGDLLNAVAPAMNDPIAVSYAAGCLLKRSGWKIKSTGGIPLITDASVMLEDESDQDRGLCLSAIRSRILPSAAAPGFLSMLRSATLGDSSVGEMIGMLRHRGGIAAMRRSIDPESVSTVEEIASTLRMDSHEPARRRAA